MNKKPNNLDSFVKLSESLPNGDLEDLLENQKYNYGVNDKEMKPIYINKDRNVTVFKLRDLRFKNAYQYSMYYDIGTNKVCWGFVAKYTDLTKEDLENIISIVLPFIKKYWQVHSGVTKSLKEKEAKQRVEDYINKIVQKRRILNCV